MPQKANPGITVAQVRSLPKVSLHDHLDGAVRTETIIELSKSLNLVLPSYTVAGLNSWIAKTCGRGSLVDYLEAFKVTSAVMQTQESLCRVAREYVLDLVEDGVIYAECRWAPFEHLLGGLTPDQACDAVEQGLDEGVNAAKLLGYDVVVRQIFCALRHEDYSHQVAELAIARRARGVVGFDLAGPEAGYPASMHQPALQLLRSNDFNVTIHAGEAAGLESIKSAIEDGHAKRLGHGIRVADGVDLSGAELDPIAQRILDDGIVLEIAPLSNHQTMTQSHFGLDAKAYPFDLLYRLGFKVTINPDNRLMSATSVTHEILELVKVFGYKLSDLITFQLNAVDGIFAGSEIQETVRAAILKFALANALEN